MRLCSHLILHLHMLCSCCVLCNHQMPCQRLVCIACSCMLARFCAAAAAECIGLHKSSECIALRQAGTVVPCLNATCFNTETVLHLAGALSRALGQFLGQCLMTTLLQSYSVASQHAVQGEGATE